MSLALALVLAALCGAQLLRWRLRERIGLEAIVLCSTSTLAVAGIVTTLLACVERASAGAIACALAVAAAVWMPWRRRRTALPPAGGWRHAILPLVIAAGAFALRWPPQEHALAGRDQGTYALRAEFTAREGAIAFVDPVLRSAATEQHAHAGPQDLLGLYPRRGERWREDLYEASYRPGWYLADREGGRVVPQFLHLHPSVMVVARMIGGRTAAAAVVVIEGVLAVLALLAIGRRLWPGSPWGGCAAAAFALSPLAIWVQRSSLTEALTGLLLATAVLACLRARTQGDGELTRAAWLLGATAWVRGNAWMTTPIVLVVLWLEPADAPRRHRATATLIGTVALGVLVHATSSFPYLADELRRQLVPWSEPSPPGLLIGCAIAALVWWSIDELGFGARGRFGAAPVVARLRALLPVLLGLALVLALALWLVRAAGASTPPWSRLDALVPGLGIAMLLPAALGVVLTVVRWRVGTRHELWLAAIVTLAVATVAIYAGRNLPRFGLYYYGRYLVPELLPIACLAGAHGLAWIAAVVGLRHRIAGHVVAAVLAGAWLAAIALPLVRTPQTRLVEQAGSARIVDALAELVPADGIVIAGGEGWHHGHTFNQVGGALAIGRGRVVLPYHSREAAYASAHELLIEAPARRGVAPPPVYLLINEATHAVRGPADPAPLAAFDDLLPPPFRARKVVLLELVTDRLTPSDDELPTAVTRDALRMALVELELDPARADEVQRVFFGARAGVAGEHGAVPIRVAAGTAIPELIGAQGPDELCLSPQRELELVLPPELAATAASVVLVATPGSADELDRWRVTIDGRERPSLQPGGPARARDTLGPFAVASAPRSIRVRGAKRANESAVCPHGGIAELRLLGADHGALADVMPAAMLFAPPLDLGHAVVPAHWVAGRGLSRYRPGIVPTPELRALSLALRPEAALEIGPEPLPHGTAIDVIVNLTAAQLGPSARIRVLADGVLLGEIDPPESRTRSWQSPPLRMTPTGAVVTWRLELVDAEPDDVAWVRDIGLFSRAH
jgi:hypothetical protein